VGGRWRIPRGWIVLGYVAFLVLGLALAWAGSGAPKAAAQSGGPLVSVFPIAGSRVVSPKAQIAFRGVPVGAFGSIQVTGSQSGSHTGKIEADSDGRGGSYLPNKPFAPGETVTVTTSLNIVGGHNGTFQFQVATPAGGIPNAGSRHVAWVRGAVWRFRSRGDLAPPAVRITHGAGAGGSADIFVTPQYGPIQNGVEILDPRGQLIWFDRMPPRNLAANLQVQTYQGKPVLTWWQGYSGAGAGSGEDVIDDTSYRQVALVHAANGVSADLHEFQLTPAGTALITAYYPVKWDASAVHGLKHEIVFDGVVQEIDIPTGLVLFQWDSLDHVPLADSYMPLPRQTGGFHDPFDYFHVNSIQLDRDGTLLISARNTWTVYKIDHSSGDIIWRLGGKHSSFRMLQGAGFAFQHDIRSRAAGDRFVTLFDDGAGGPRVHSQSRALELNLDLKDHTARVYKQWDHSPHLLSYFEGNDEQLPDLDEFVGWGQNPYFTEFDQSGRTVLDGRFVSNTASYRAYRYSWSATPATPPAVVATASGNRTTVYVSWNGATNVSSWQVLEGATPTSLQPVATVPKTGFETVINVKRASYLRVQPLGSHGQVLLPAGGLATDSGMPTAIHVRDR
jgi:Arylsulfotransferase (ASST)